jgi:hypothetical protein
MSSDKYQHQYAQAAHFHTDAYVNTSGWMNVEGTVGKGYGDRIIASNYSDFIQLPDERTSTYRHAPVLFHYVLCTNALLLHFVCDIE